MPNFDFLEPRIAGLHHHQFVGDKANSLEFGLNLILVREPENPHDRNAVRIDHPDGRKVGYIPANQAAWVSRLIDHGHALGCQVAFVSAPQSLVAVTLTLPDLRPTKESAT